MAGGSLMKGTRTLTVRRENKIISWAALRTMNPSSFSLSHLWPAENTKRECRGRWSTMEVPRWKGRTASVQVDHKALEWCSNKSHWKIARPRARREVSYTIFFLTHFLRPLFHHHPCLSLHSFLSFVYFGDLFGESSRSPYSLVVPFRVRTWF